MKTYFKILSVILLVLVLAAIIGVLLPFLFSAKSTVAFVLGLTTSVLLLAGAGNILVKAFSK